MAKCHTSGHDTRPVLLGPAVMPDRRRVLVSAAAVGMAAAVPLRALASANAHTIALTNRVALADIAGVVYAKPKVNTPPSYSCLFYQRSTPGSIADLYATAAGTLSGGVASYYG